MIAPNPKRHIAIQGLIIFLLSILVVRLFYLQIIKHDFFDNKAFKQLRSIINLYPHRGYIYDKFKRPLAMTANTYDVFAVPSEIKKPEETAREMLPYLSISYPHLVRLLSKKDSFEWIERQVIPENAAKLKALNLRGIGFIKTEKRIYPYGNLACHVLGFVGVDNQGLGGLEFHYDKLLKGSPGKVILERDPRGVQLVSGRRDITPPYDGQHIITTIDPRLQYSAQKHLASAVISNGAAKGQIIVMDPKTGSILAMACYPDFDPNDYKSTTHHKNATVVDVYEPGSVFKSITLAAAIDQGIAEPDTVFIVPETLQVKNRVISEAHELEAGGTSRKTVTDILSESLNVGTSLIAMRMGEKTFYNYMKNFGFGQRTGIQFSGESRGMLRPLARWSGVDIAMISFGQGIAVTSIQLAAATAAIANNGMYMQPRVVDYTTDHDSETRRAVPITQKKQVVKPETARKVVDMMVHVVEKGTGTTAKIPGYYIAGKTGTAQKVKENGFGYEPGKYVASFIGFFPAHNPQVLILVSVDSPRKSIYGSTVAAPVFKAVAKDIIDYYNIPPEYIATSSRSL